VEITFLGTSSGVPTKSRNVSSLALRFSQSSDLWLFDCGEGTQHQLLKSKLKFSKLKKIFISHMHGDHIYGLPGLLASIGLAGKSSGIEIYGPKNLKSFLLGVFESSCCHINYEIKFFEIQPKANKKEVIFENEVLKVSTILLKHRIPTFAYRIDEKDKPGRFNLEKAKKFQISPGPIYSRLQKGETVRLPDGRIIKGEDFCGEKRKGKSFVFCTDTLFTESVIELAKNADLLIHESTFAKNEELLAFERMHSTSEMAAKTAKLARVEKLFLTHLSPRYVANTENSPERMLAEARGIFKNTHLAKDFLSIDLNKRCNSS
tara:strand:- start:3700 stop:4656 length:957 start_codon:yes stop_codon:yes gene_type:complete